MASIRILGSAVARSITTIQHRIHLPGRRYPSWLLREPSAVLSCVTPTPVRLTSVTVKRNNRKSFYEDIDSGGPLSEEWSARNSNKEEPVDLNQAASDENWSEEFGTLSNETNYENLEEFKEEEEEDKREARHIRLSATNRKHTPYYYGRQVEKLSKQGRVQEAIDMVLNTMLQEDRVMPTSYNFTVLIGAVGKTGDVKTAFKLFNKMKGMGLKPEDPTYTALFNACAICQNKNLALSKANHLRDLMDAKEHSTNQTTFHAMLKCYALAKDTATVFQIADEMMRCRVNFDYATFSFLLMGCISDKEVGFDLALQLWRRMRKRGITFDVQHYNLLIKAISDCGVQQTAPPLGSAEQQDSAELAVTSRQVNILNPRTNLEVALRSAPVATPQDRLALIGGLPGLLRHMEVDKSSPNVQTFTQLLLCVPESKEAEHQLVRSMESSGVKPDVAFMNMLIRRRNKRQDNEGAKDVLIMMGYRGLQADMMTFGCLAMGCLRERDGNELLKHIKELNSVPSLTVWGLLVHQSDLNFGYKKRLLQRMMHMKIAPNRILIQHVERQVVIAKRHIINKEMGKLVPKIVRREYFSAEFHEFLEFYEYWLRRTDIHPDVDQ